MTYNAVNRASPSDPAILESVRNSQLNALSIRVTASRAGIAKTTLMDWLTAGRLELADYNSGKLEELGSLGSFAVQYDKAACDREAVNTQAITASITDNSVNFVPALILNKARNPADWLEARQVNVTSHVTVLTAQLPQLAEAELLALLSDKLASGRKLLT